MLTLFVGIALAAGADAPSSAAKALASLEYARAAELSLLALTAGALNPRQTHEMWAVRAQALAAQGFADDARIAFERALSLAPTFEVRPDASPKLTAPFRQARERIGSRRLAATVQLSPAGDGWDVSVALVDDVAGLGARAEVRDLPGKPVALTRFADRFSGRFRCPAPCSATLSVLDDFGNRLLELGRLALPTSGAAVEKPPAMVVPAEKPSAPMFASTTTPGPSFWSRPAVWWVAAGVCAIAAAVFAFRWSADAATLRRVADAPSDHSAAELRAAERIAPIDQGLTLGASGLALALATVGFITW